MTDTLTKRNRDKARKAFEPVIKKWEDGSLIEFAVPGDTDFLDEIIETHLSLLPNGISQDAHDMLYGSEEVNERIAKEDDMRERIERTFSTRPTDSPDWVKTIRALIKAEDEKGWDIERFWAWNQDDSDKDRKYDRLRFSDLVKKPVLIISHLPRAFETNTSQSMWQDLIDHDCDTEDDEEIEETPVPVGAEIPWYRAVSTLELECSPRVMEYINKTKAVRLEEGCLTVSVPDQDTKDWLDSRVRSTAERLMIGICGEKVAVDFVIAA